MKTIFVKDIRENQKLESTFLVKHQGIARTRTGNPYLNLTLGDTTGEIEGKVWDHAEPLAQRFQKDDFIRVQATAVTYQNALQLTISSLTRCSSSEIDITDFLPQAKHDRFKEQYNLNDEHAQVLTDSRLVADYFEQTVSSCKNIKLTANWVMGEILRLSKEKRIEVDKLSVTPERLGTLLSLMDDGTISPNAAKKILNRIEQEDREPEELLEEMGLKQISDASALEDTVKQILDAHPDEVKRFKEGQKKLSSFFVGQAMKMTKGKGNPKEINKILSKLLEG